MNIQIYSEHCCGCGECFNVCPTGAIKMEKDSKGFYYPTVDAHKCIDCSLCASSCSFNKPIDEDCHVLDCYIAKNKNLEVRMSSRSGGMFSIFADSILKRKGVVYGCVLKENKEAVHCRIDTAEDLQLLQGSKYIQSKIHDCFKPIKEDLKSGLWVLFAGTACQVNAVRDYCQDIDCSNLLLIDIVCHGVPSPQVWLDYYQWISRKLNKKIVGVDFRDKKNFGWAAHVETFTLEDNSTFSCDYFKNLFYSHYVLRENCFDCPFKNLNRVGDITLSDSWGIEQESPDFNDDKGVSLVLINTEKGKKYLNEIKECIDRRKVNVSDYLQPPLQGNWEKPERNSQFWDDYFKNGFIDTYNRYIKNQETIDNSGKKIGILTFHFPQNCGAILQAYALMTSIQKFRDCEIINYQPDYHASWGNYRYHYEYPPKRIREILHHNNKLRGMVSVVYNFPQIMANKKYHIERKRTRCFEKFIDKHLKLSPKFKWRGEVLEHSNNYEAIVSGSDQVWNPRIYGNKIDDVYLLPFKDDIKKYSFAASAGGDWKDSDAVFMSLYLNQFEGVSIRERDLAQALEKRNVNCRVDIDPTLLLEAQDYYSLEKSIPVNGEFVFVYAFHITDELIDVLEQLNERWNCNFISYPFEGKLQEKLSFKITELDPMGPSEFLWLMHNAKYVVTSTFHGLAFAAIYEKQFICLPPEHGKSRIENFMSSYGLEARYYRADINIFQSVDYSTYHNALVVNREEAIDYIKKICEE